VFLFFLRGFAALGEIVFVVFFLSRFCDCFFGCGYAALRPFVVKVFHRLLVSLL